MYYLIALLRRLWRIVLAITPAPRISLLAPTPPYDLTGTHAALDAVGVPPAGIGLGADAALASRIMQLGAMQEARAGALREILGAVIMSCPDPMCMEDDYCPLCNNLAAAWELLAEGVLDQLAGHVVVPRTTTLAA